MRRTYVLAGMGVLAAAMIVTPALGGPSLRSLVEDEVARQLSGDGASMSAKGKRKGRRGPRGPAGPPGAAGAPGAPGAAGAAAASAFTGRVEGLSPGNGAVEFAYPDGLTTAPNTVVAVRQFGSPNAAIVLRDLRVSVDAAPGAGLTRTYAVVDDGSITAVMCAMNGAAQTTCDSAGATATVAAGSQLSFRILNVGSPGGTTATFGYRATTP